MVDIFPPKIFLLIRISKEDHSPGTLVDLGTEICGVDDEVNRSRMVLLFRHFVVVQILEDRLLVVSGSLLELLDRLLVEYICVPEIFVSFASAFASKSATARLAPVRLDAILNTSFNDGLKPAFRAIFSFFVDIRL